MLLCSSTSLVWFSRYGNLLGDSAAEQTDAEQDALKRTLLDTNPYLLAVTVCVSVVHSVFEFLAFKNGKYTVKDLVNAQILLLLVATEQLFSEVYQESMLMLLRILTTIFI